MEGRGHKAQGNGPMSYALCPLPFVFCLLLSAVLATAAPRQQPFIGTITDNMCGNAGHAGMRMGPTDAECTIACIDAHGAVYVLYDGKAVYNLSDQQRPAEFAGRRVKVVGTLDVKSKTIQVKSIALERP
jgi:hypothetical protein